jgi:hypothetical protein
VGGFQDNSRSPHGGPLRPKWCHGLRFRVRLSPKADSETTLHAGEWGTSAVERADVAIAGAGVTEAMAIFRTPA